MSVPPSYNDEMFELRLYFLLAPSLVCGLAEGCFGHQLTHWLTEVRGVRRWWGTGILCVNIFQCYLV